jgi:DNA-binding NarL/FixJ family response regulator
MSPMPATARLNAWNRSCFSRTSPARSRVVAAVPDAGALLAAVAADPPDAAVVDVRMPPTYTDEGLRAALTIRSAYPGVGVLVFSQWVETGYARQLLSENAGRVGYLLKDRIVSTDEFVGALRRVADGGTALDPEVVRQLLAAPAVDAVFTKLDLPQARTDHRRVLAVLRYLRA